MEEVEDARVSTGQGDSLTRATASNRSTSPRFIDPAKLVPACPGGNYAPQKACNLQWIYVPNPLWLRK